MKYQRLEDSAIVEAIQFDLEDFGHDWSAEGVEPWPDGRTRNESVGYLVNADQSLTHVRPGDWIVTDEAGVKAVVHPDVFAEAYQPVQEP